MNQARKIVVTEFEPRAQPRPSLASWYTPGFSDGLGDRLLMFDNTASASLELLRFKPEFGDHPAFEQALRLRIKQLDQFSHPSVARVRSVDGLGDGEGLALVSNHVPGRRLSEVLGDARGPSFSVDLLRQLTPVLVSLQRDGQGVAHGALSPDRIVITPRGRLMIVEHVVGAALEALHLPVYRLKADLGIAIPAGHDSLKLDSRTDIVQLAFVALCLLIGRAIDPADYPERGEELLDEFDWTATSSPSASLRLRAWLERALQLNGQTFATAQDAYDALTDLPKDQELLMAVQPRTFHHIPSASESPALPHPLDTTEHASAFAENATARSNPVERPSWPIEAQKRLASGAQALPAPRTAPAAPAPRARSRATPWIMAALAALVITEGVGIAGLVYTRRAGNAASVQPPQAITMALKTPAVAPPAPARELNPELRDGAVAAGATVGTGTGVLEVQSDPPGAKVTIDGKPHGVTPLTLQLPTGPHAVVVSDGKTTATRTMNASMSGTSTLIASMSPSSAPPAGATGGWVSIGAPVELQVREGSSILGITSADRLMLPAGHHELEVGSAALGVQQRVSVDIQAGRTTKTTVNVPNGSLSVNAVPWANVWVDGQPLNGTTPFANLAVPLGTHEIIYRHPQLGERRDTVVVTAKAPVRLVKDLRK